MITTTTNGHRLIRSTQSFRGFRKFHWDKFLDHAGFPSAYSIYPTALGNFAVVLESRLADGVSYFYVYGDVQSSLAAATEIYWPQGWQNSMNPNYSIGEWFNTVPWFKFTEKFTLSEFSDFLLHN